MNIENSKIKVFISEKSEQIEFHGTRGGVLVGMSPIEQGIPQGDKCANRILFQNHLLKEESTVSEKERLEEALEEFYEFFESTPDRTDVMDDEDEIHYVTYITKDQLLKKLSKLVFGSLPTPSKKKSIIGPKQKKMVEYLKANPGSTEKDILHHVYGMFQCKKGSDCLRRAMDCGHIIRVKVQGKPHRFEYHVSE